MEHINQLEKYILTNIYEQDRLPSSCKTAIGQEALRGLIVRNYITKTGEGIHTIYKLTKNGLGLIDAEEIDMEEETLMFDVADECHLWSKVVRSVIDQGNIPDTAIRYADEVIAAYKARGVDIYSKAKALNKIIADAQENQVTSEDGVILPFKEPN